MLAPNFTSGKKSVQGGRGINHAPSGVNDYLCFIVKNIIFLTLVDFIIIFCVKITKKLKACRNIAMHGE